jgi:NodT family efflux transporter outer membrane factor (OMF) lipoprotein
MSVSRREPGRYRCGPESRGWIAVLAAVLLWAGLAGCTFHQASQPERTAKLPGAFSATGKTPLPDRWWKALRDPALDGLVERALSGNPGLKATWDRLDQARAVAKKAGASRWPTLTGTAGGTASISGMDGSTGAGPSASTSKSATFSGALAAGYEVDLWGRLRSGREAAALDAEASAQDLRSAALSLSAEVANAWIQLASLRREERLLDAQLETATDALAAIEVRFRRGRVTAADVLQQRQSVEALRGERTRLRASLEVGENRLAVLTGEAPGRFKAPAGRSLPVLSPLPATGTPAQWLQRRPDLQAALARVRAADWRVAEAVADRFPQLALSGRVSGSAEVTETVLTWLANLAANLTAPLLDGGRRKAEVERTRAVVSERLHQYGSALLDAVEEVENGLAREASQEAYIRSLEKQLALSSAAVEQAESGYRGGTVEFLRFLTATLTHQRLERTLHQAQRDRVLYRVALYRSLAGSWKVSREKGSR